MLRNGTVYSTKYNKYLGSIIKDTNHIMVSKYHLHRLIWMVANQAEIPDGYDVHHIDHNPLNNSIYNLELIEHNKHMSYHSSKQIYTEETRQKLSIIHKGCKHSEETKKKMSVSRKDKKKVAQYTLDGELVKVWDSFSEIGRNGYCRETVSGCCNGRYKTCKGYKWKLMDE